MVRLIAALLILWPGLALAEWRAQLRDDGALFYGSLLSDPRGLYLSCIGPSRGNVPPEQIEVHEIARSPIRGFLLHLAPDLYPPRHGSDRRSDFVIWIDGTGYGLPETILNEMEDGWQVSLSMTDPLISALKTASYLIVGPTSGPQYRFPTDGIGAALADVLTFCDAEYARLGYPVPQPGPALVTEEFQGGMRAVAQAAIQQGCQGDFAAEGEYALVGNIDGDGDDDVVVDWGAITCQGPLPRPFCGASQCSADVFISAARPQAKPGTNALLAQGVSLIPLNNGLDGIRVGGSLGMCREAGKGGTGCHFIWYWSGSELERLP